MKKELFLALVFLISVPLMNTLGSNERKKRANAQVTSDSQSPGVSSIDGAWKLVYSKRNDTVIHIGRYPQLKMFCDGNFSLIAHDSSGKISTVGYGKFELQGTSYKETFVYHNHPRYVGGIAWQEHEVRGDTLYAKGFKKVIVGGKEATGFPRIEEKRVKVKW